ncbi:MAG: hypothetical protein OXU33_14355 [Gemmatimonadota bacterium]|nr:hypothetical protein [Gemmatimonadota bacterium]MDE3004895.1 hypothetical protein [Gemmatimonadota bacterium]MDE3015245.1 hypothetical protein [Gemmatimonadota bacterium]
MTCRRMILAAGFLMVLALALPAHAEAQVAGTWELAIDGPRGPQTMLLVLKVEGSELRGTLTPRLPEAGGSERRGDRAGAGRPQGRGVRPGGGRVGGQGPPEIEIADTSLDGDSFSFAAVMGMRGNALSFTGTVDRDEMSGTISTPRGERAFTGMRVD